MCYLKPCTGKRVLAILIDHSLCTENCLPAQGLKQKPRCCTMDKLTIILLLVISALTCSLCLILMDDSVSPKRESPLDQLPFDNRFENRGKVMLAHADPTFSSHFCVGGRLHEAWGPKDRLPERQHLSEAPPTDVGALTCVFRNLRYLGGRKFEYYVDSNGAFPFEFDNNGTVQLQPWLEGPILGHHQHPISLVSAPLGTKVPKKSISRKSNVDDRVFVIGTMGPLHLNIGHQMMDGSWLALETMQRTQMMDPR